MTCVWGTADCTSDWNIKKYAYADTHKYRNANTQGIEDTQMQTHTWKHMLEYARRNMKLWLNSIYMHSQSRIKSQLLKVYLLGRKTKTEKMKKQTFKFWSLNTIAITSHRWCHLRTSTHKTMRWNKSKGALTSSSCLNWWITCSGEKTRLMKLLLYMTNFCKHSKSFSTINRYIDNHTTVALKRSFWLDDRHSMIAEIEYNSTQTVYM